MAPAVCLLSLMKLHVATGDHPVFLCQQAYLLRAALEEPIRVVNELKPILSELRGWGRNLNQLTVLAHSGRVQTVYLQELTAALAKTYEAVNCLLTEKDGVISCGNVQLHPGT